MAKNENERWRIRLTNHSTGEVEVADGSRTALVKKAKAFVDSDEDSTNLQVEWERLDDEPIEVSGIAAAADEALVVHGLEEAGAENIEVKPAD